MNIALDLMGGDYAPEEVLAGIELYFSENSGIASKSIRSSGKTTWKIVPQSNAYQIKKNLRSAISREFCEISENENIYNRGENWVDEKPNRA